MPLTGCEVVQEVIAAEVENKITDTNTTGIVRVSYCETGV